MINDQVKKSKVIFFDFDGVLKDSVEVKANAFEKLFLPFGNDVATKVKKHHEDNGGMSRFEKLPIYLNLAGHDQSPQDIKMFEKKFSSIVKQKVIEAPWVPGSLRYLKKYCNEQSFFLITATPQKEIEAILLELGILECFIEIVGSPTNKFSGIKMMMEKYNINSHNAIMIGDSIIDFEAAKNNKIHFILRETKFNKDLQNLAGIKKISNFL
jgi:phosphoglycolate phosphatase-like HAD superfamily hydrolase